MAITVRNLAEGEFRVWLDTVESAFGEEQTEQAAAANERLYEPERILVADEDGRMVGGAAAFSFRLTVPGGEVGAAGVSAVGVVPTHRRRGALTALMKRQLEDVRLAGEPVAILWASEGSIYQRFGYGLATLAGTFQIPRSRAAFRVPHEPEGTLRMVDMAEAARTFPAIHDAVRRVTPGFIDRTETWWEAEILPDPEYRRRGAGPRFLVLHEVDGRPEGYVIYRIRGEWDETGSKSTLQVRELMGSTPRSLRELWRFCFGHDLIANVRASLRAPDDPVLLLLAEPRRLTLADGLWLRIVDVAAALGGRSYRVADVSTFELSDAVMPDLAGRWRLDTTGDAPLVTRTDDPPDLALDVTDLAALYLDAFSASDLWRAGRCVELRDGAVLRADALFRWDRRPWCALEF